MKKNRKLKIQKVNNEASKKEYDTHESLQENAYDKDSLFEYAENDERHIHFIQKMKNEEEFLSDLDELKEKHKTPNLDETIETVDMEENATESTINADDKENLDKDENTDEINKNFVNYKFKEIKIRKKDNEFKYKYASKEQIKQDLLNKAYIKDISNSKYKRRKASFVRKIWGNIALPKKYTPLILTLAIIIFSFAIILLLPPFYVKEISVEGNKVISKEELIRVSGIKLKQNIISGLGGSLENWFNLEYGKAQDKIVSAFTEIDKVSITPSLPGKIVIKVKERVPIAYLAINNSYAQIDKYGVVIRISEEKPKFAPIIEGQLSEVVELGKKISDDLKNEISKAILVLNQMITLDVKDNDGFYIVDTVKIIRLEGHNRLLLTLDSKKHQINVAISANLSLNDEINWLRHAMISGTFDKNPDGLIDLTGSHKVFIPLRNIFPYKRFDWEIDAINALTNPILQQEKLEKNASASEEDKKNETNNME